jgi:type IV pilus assembly protein PilN
VIRTNLSTRPFYNEGAVRAWLTVLAIVAVAATIFNVSRVLGYSRSDTELATQASRDEARAAEVRATAAKLRASVDTKQVDVASVEARQANDLIDRRTFSWTELFNRLETTLPPEVRITSVRPALDRDRRITLTISVLARGVDDVNEFMERLEATGAFANLLSREERISDSGQLVAVLECEYVQPASEQVKS